LSKSRAKYLLKGTGEKASKPKIVAEWESEEGTRFLVRTRFETAEEGHKKERYDTKEVTPDVVEGTDALEFLREFQQTKPDEWKKHNENTLKNWEKEKSKMAEENQEDPHDHEGFRAWLFPIFCGLWPA
jgi:hypothetical protein